MDPPTAIKKLIDSGMPEQQAESVVEIQAMLFYHNLATKADLANLRAEIKSASAESRTDIATYRSDMNALLAATKADIIRGGGSRHQSCHCGFGGINFEIPMLPRRIG